MSDQDATGRNILVVRTMDFTTKILPLERIFLNVKQHVPMIRTVDLLNGPGTIVVGGRKENVKT